MATLTADGGEITVGRQVASYVYGSWDVKAPDEVEAEEKDDRTDWAFIYRPDNRPTGRFDVAFVKADASMDMELHESTTEQVIDTASKRVAGEVFFEQEISGAGLGRYVPGEHFRVGDLVDVRLWSRTLPLPVTAIDLESKVETPIGYSVHVGGQMVTDAEKLRQHNDKIEKQIASDRRKAEKELGKVRSTANSAKKTAEQVREDLGLPSGESGGLFGEYLSKLGEDGDVTRDLLRINATLWDDQYGWNATQEAINEAQRKINEVNEQRINDQEDALEAIRKVQKASLQQQVRIGRVDRSTPMDDKYIQGVSNSSSDLTITGKGKWTGTIYATTFNTNASGGNPEEGATYQWSMPTPTGSRTISTTISRFTSALVQYLVDAGVQKNRDLVSTAGLTIPTATWTADERHTFTAPVTANYSIWMRVTWETPQTLRNYGIEISRNGQYIKATGLSNGLFPAKEHSLRVIDNESASMLQAGDKIEFRLFADTNYAPGRTASRVDTKISWIEENE